MNIKHLVVAAALGLAACAMPTKATTPPASIHPHAGLSQQSQAVKDNCAPLAPALQLLQQNNFYPVIMGRDADPNVTYWVFISNPVAKNPGLWVLMDIHRDTGMACIVKSGAGFQLFNVGQEASD